MITENIKKPEMSKREFKRYKKQIFKSLDFAITNDKPFIVLGETNDNKLLMMGGSHHSLSLMVAQSMNVSSDFDKVVRIAIRATDFANKLVNKKEKECTDDKKEDK